MSLVPVLIAALVAQAHAHGRTSNPPNRASAWRFGYNSPANYDDDGLNCGGFYHQWSVNDGKCGICGDPYDSEPPRAHELGGKYGLGYIVASYSSGQVIPITTILSASHLGFWEFRICPDPYDNNQECFDEYLLELEEGGTKYYPTEGSGVYQTNYRLPPGLKCEHCVLQWRYTAGNNWGVCDDGTQGLGCGNQEQFFSCSDISIGGNDSDGNDDESNDIDDKNDVTDLDKDDSAADGNDDSTDSNDSNNDDATNDSNNDKDNEIDTDSDSNVSAESPYVPVGVPIIYLTDEGLLRLLVSGNTGNEIPDERHRTKTYPKYTNRHKRKSKKGTKRRKQKRIPLY